MTHICNIKEYSYGSYIRIRTYICDQILENQPICHMLNKNVCVCGIVIGTRTHLQNISDVSIVIQSFTSTENLYFKILHPHISPRNT